MSLSFFLNYSFCLPTQLINIFCFKLGYFLYPKISVSPLQWPFPQYGKHAAQVTDVFITKMEVVLSVCILIVQNFSLSIFHHIIHLSWVNPPMWRNFKEACLPVEYCVWIEIQIVEIDDVLCRKISKISYKNMLTFQSVGGTASSTVSPCSNGEQRDTGPLMHPKEITLLQNSPLFVP